MDAFFQWLETSGPSTVLRENPSIMAFPFILILHTVGLGFLVGANVAINARVLGLARGVRRRAEVAPVAAGTRAPQALRALALAGMACWLIAIFAGRFLAYTCT